jgi:hypothetical protein
MMEGHPVLAQKRRDVESPEILRLYFLNSGRTAACYLLPPKHTFPL